ncbi:MAG: beta-lactamase, partial [Haliea sp.]
QQEQAIPGLEVGIIEGGRTHFFGYGIFTKSTEAPGTAGTLYELGSLSKCFTATLATYAQATGRLALTDPPGKHLPALRGSALDHASLLQFGTYTAAGLPLQFPDAVQTDAAALAWLRSFQPTAAPGTVRRYSNPSIGLMGHAVAAALGKSYAAACEQDLFPALGLKDTFVRVPSRAMPAYAWGTSRTGEPVRVNPGAFDAEAYGIKSTMFDMLAFVQAQLAPGTLAPALRSAVLQTQAPRFEVGAMVQGLGWEQYPWPCPAGRLQDGNSTAMALEPQPARAIAATPWDARSTLFNKTGSTNGFGAYVAFIPARGAGLVMLANRNIPNSLRVSAAHQVLLALAPG